MNFSIFIFHNWFFFYPTIFTNCILMFMFRNKNLFTKYCTEGIQALAIYPPKPIQHSILLCLILFKFLKATSLGVRRYATGVDAYLYCVGRAVLHRFNNFPTHPFRLSSYVNNIAKRNDLWWTKNILNKLNFVFES